jgi:hypothetical protein
MRVREGKRIELFNRSFLYLCVPNIDAGASLSSVSKFRKSTFSGVAFVLVGKRNLKAFLAQCLYCCDGKGKCK